MTFFQLILFVIAGGIFYIFFKKLFSGNYPKRGIDFEAKLPNENIGGISTSEKIFAKPTTPSNRIDDLVNMAKKSIDIKDFDDASKALQSAIILEPNNIDVLHMIGYVELQTDKLESAKENYEKILSLDADDDLAHASLANILHKLDDNTGAIMHHERSIELDSQYAKHYFNYANTLFDMKEFGKAKENYTTALKLDSELREATEMIKKCDQ